MERRMVERQKKIDGKTREEWKEGKNGGQMKAGRWKEEWNDKKEWWKERRKTKRMEKGWIDRRKNMEKKRQKKKIFCIIDLL